MQHNEKNTICMAGRRLDPARANIKPERAQSNTKIALSDCLYCCGNSFYVELDSSEAIIAIACSACGNRADLPIRNLVGFSVRRWNNINNKDLMYTRIRPLYERWNQLNYQSVFNPIKINNF